MLATVASSPAKPSLLTISELSARSGVAPSALRFYEGLGLITATRTAGNQRRYPRHALRRVAFIRAGRQLGLELREISESLALLPAGKAPTRAQWSRAARAWQARIGAKLAELQRLWLPVAPPVRSVQPAGRRRRTRPGRALAPRR